MSDPTVNQPIFVERDRDVPRGPRDARNVRARLRHFTDGSGSAHVRTPGRVAGMVRALSALRWSRDRLDRYVHHRLDHVLSTSWHGSAFYRDFWRAAGVTRCPTASDLTRLPVVRKAELAAVPIEHVLTERRPLSTGIVRCTSGSSGEPLRFFIPHEAHDWFLAIQFRVYALGGARPWHKIAYVRDQIEPIGFRFGLFPACFFHLSLSPEALYEGLVRERPDIVACYPSTALELTRTIDPHRLQRLGLRGLFVNTEQSTAHEHARLASAFGCKVYDDYGTEEVWMVASQCGHGRYHIWADNVHLEILDDAGAACPAGTPGRVVVTCLANLAMPFIRYELGDLAASCDERCPCGLSFPLLAALSGRAKDSFVLPNGRHVTAVHVHNAVESVERPESIRCFQVVQERPTEIIFRYVAADAHAERTAEASVARLTALLGDPALTIRAMAVPEIAREPSGKLRPIRSLCT